MAVPGAAPVVVHEDVDDLARLPVRAGQRDEAAGRVVIEVAGDGGRGDRLGRRRLGSRVRGWGQASPASPRALIRPWARRLAEPTSLRASAPMTVPELAPAWIPELAPRSARPTASARGSDRRSALRPGRRPARRGSRPAGLPAVRRRAAGVTGGRIGAPESSRFPAPARTAISGTATTSQDVDGAVESRTTATIERFEGCDGISAARRSSARFAATPRLGHLCRSRGTPAIEWTPTVLPLPAELTTAH